MSSQNFVTLVSNYPFYTATIAIYSTSLAGSSALVCSLFNQHNLKKCSSALALAKYVYTPTIYDFLTHSIDTNSSIGNWTQLCCESNIALYSGKLFPPFDSYFQNTTLYRDNLFYRISVWKVQFTSWSHWSLFFLLPHLIFDIILRLGEQTPAALGSLFPALSISSMIIYSALIYYAHESLDEWAPKLFWSSLYPLQRHVDFTACLLHGSSPSLEYTGIPIRAVLDNTSTALEDLILKLESNLTSGKFSTSR